MLHKPQHFTRLPTTNPSRLHFITICFTTYFSQILPSGTDNAYEVVIPLLKHKEGMDIITLRTDGSILHEGRVVESEPLAFLPFKTELQDGYTLRSYFTMLHKYPLLTKLSPFFPVYMKQYSECPQAGCITNDIHHLELSKTIEMIGFPGKPQIEIYISFNGICGDQACELKPYPLKNLLDMALKLGKLKHIVFGDKVDIFEFETVFTLFEFLDGIAWVLSFQAGSIECQLRR